MYELIKRLAANDKNMLIGEKLIACLGVTLLAMAIVFVVLIILMYVIKGLKMISEEKKPAAAGPAPAPAVPAPAAVETSSQTDESEVIAAVMAAVNCMSSGEGSKIIIRNIVKKNESWASAGLLEQMNSRL